MNPASSSPRKLLILGCSSSTTFPKTMKSTLTSLLTLIALAQALPNLQAQQPIRVPPTMNYQGLLVDPDGNKLPDGNTNVIFRVWDSASGGNLLWGPKTNSVAMVGGVFNTLIGGNDSAVPARDFASVLSTQAQVLGSPAFLELSLRTTAIQPRQQILAAPFSWVANSANTAQTANYATVAGSSTNASKLNGFSWADLLTSDNASSAKLDGSKIVVGSLPLDRLRSDKGTPLVEEENHAAGKRLKIIRGVVTTDGQIKSGSGFSVRVAVADPLLIYVITFAQPFADGPSILVTPADSSTDAVFPRVNNPAGHPDAAYIEFRRLGNPATGTKVDFSFIAIGAQ